MTNELATTTSWAKSALSFEYREHCSRRTFTPTEELPPSFQAVTRRH